MLALVVLLLCGCQGKALPEGMDEAVLLQKGRETALLLAGGDDIDPARFGQANHGSRGIDPARDLRQTDGAGVYKEIDSVMATGQSSNGEDYGVAVVYCKYSKKNVLFRLAFDTSYELIGLEVRKP